MPQQSVGKYALIVPSDINDHETHLPFVHLLDQARGVHILCKEALDEAGDGWHLDSLYNRAYFTVVLSATVRVHNTTSASSVLHPSCIVSCARVLAVHRM